MSSTGASRSHRRRPRHQCSTHRIGPTAIWSATCLRVRRSAPTCGGPHRRESQCRRRARRVAATSMASSPVWSIPRCRRRHQWLGTGTTNGTDRSRPPGCVPRASNHSAVARISCPSRRPSHRHGSPSAPYFAAASTRTISGASETSTVSSSIPAGGSGSGPTGRDIAAANVSCHHALPGVARPSQASPIDSTTRRVLRRSKRGATNRPRPCQMLIFDSPTTTTPRRPRLG
jgi:hypothetical protein